MSVNKLGITAYEFGTFRLIPEEHLLLRDGKPVSLSPKVFEVLVCLVEQEGHLIKKNDLLDRLWADSFVEEATLARTISSLRKALHETGDSKFIETVPKSGYRFVADVRHVTDAPTSTAAITIADNLSSAGSFVQTNNAAISESVVSIASLVGAFGRHFASRPILFITLLATFAILIGLIISWSPQSGSSKEIKSIAVLPFNKLGEGERDTTLEFGMADTLIARLSNLKTVIVRPTSAVTRYADQNYDAVTVGRDLKVDAVVEGSIQKSGERMRVTVQVISTADGAPVWAEQFDTDFTDIFTVQDSISEQVVRALSLQLSGEERKLVTKRSTENTEAYRLYITGRYFWNKRSSIESLRKSTEYYEQAIAIDPQYALAYTGLADCYQLLAEYLAAPPAEGFAKARAAAKKALEIDDRLPEAHTSLAYTLAFYDWDFAAAEDAFKRALELDPNYATAHQWYGEFLIAMGRFDEAKTEHEKALQIDPTSLVFHTELAAYYYATRQFDEAISQSRTVIEMDPKNAFGYVFLSFSLGQKGMRKEAAEAYIGVVESFGGGEEAKELKHVLANEGVDTMWLKRIEQVDQPGRRESFPAQWRSLLHIWAGQNKEALDWLEIAYERRDRWIINAKYSPEMDPLRSDPRFQDLLKRIGL